MKKQVKILELGWSLLIATISFVTLILWNDLKGLLGINIIYKIIVVATGIVYTTDFIVLYAIRQINNINNNK